MAVDDDTFISLDNAVGEPDNGVSDTLLDDICLHEIVSSNEESMQELGNAGEVVTRVELELAYSSEKLLNLEILLMNVSAKDCDYECLAMEKETSEDRLEFDFLCGIMDSEVRELDAVMDSLQTQILDARQRISSWKDFKEAFIKMEEKLDDSAESLKKLKNQLLEMRIQSAKLQRTALSFDGRENCKDHDSLENGQFSSVNTKLMMQTAEQKKDILRMLEKSLARELDLEKKLYDSRQNEEGLRLKLHQREMEAFCMEVESENVWERLFEAENAADLLMGMSKELMGKLQIIQFNLNVSIQRDGEMRSKTEKCLQHSKTEESATRKVKTSSLELDNILLEQVSVLKAKLKEAEEKCILVYSEDFTLREKIESLEEQLKESENQLQYTKFSLEKSQVQQDIFSAKIIEIEDVFQDLRKNLSEVECMAENLDSKCRSLKETNMELNEEMVVLKHDNEGKISLLDKQLKELNIQLQHAKASDEASQEQQSMLYAAIGDFENLIKDLKARALKAENRAQSAETKCVLLSETNLELNEELGFLRGRVECLETSLRQADDGKVAFANGVNIRTKAIADMVLHLGKEREHVQKLISSLTEENQSLVKKLRANDSVTGHDINAKAPKEGEQFLVANFGEKILSKDALASETEVGPVSPKDGVVLGTSNVETVRTMDIWQLNSKFSLAAILILLISVLVVWMFQNEKCPF